MPNIVLPVARYGSADRWTGVVEFQVRAQESVANLGTLTCTIGAAPDNPGADVKLSCNFKPTPAAPARL